jgi:branched-chain amino acid aminotransferase
MQSGKYFLHNDAMVSSGTKIISADNRSFRFGDGLFETMRMVDGRIALINYHLERLLASLAVLKFELPAHFTAAYLAKQIQHIAAQNQQEQAARIRLTVYRSDGGLYDHENNFPNYIIQTWKQETAQPAFPATGLTTGIFTKARKTCDDFSHIKSNNYLAYVMAALWAKKNSLDDAFVINNFNRVADATIANIFVVKDGTISTPALTEGCVGGVMRRFLIRKIKEENMPLVETGIEPEALYSANEIFLTNAISGIKPVGQCGECRYDAELSGYLFEKFVAPLFAGKID